ncbi:phage major capsid protein [Clostridium tyrobutyricum]|uniref:phage major capsid protein n=1 Tax=Clostridium tyrobutyricum TaxID=1519 RepID=UPI0020CD0CCD|nr:phage major capsid protein [Clostridium tyrobutyricum]
MAMKSKDLIQQELKNKLVQAFKSENPDDITQAFTDFAESVQQNVLQEYNVYQRTQDSNILAKRGMHQLTSVEQKYYEKLIDAMKSSNPKQAITDIDVAFPETIIDNVMQDIQSEHPLLNAVTFVNTTILTKILVNKQGSQMATWGPINSKITEELQGTISEMSLTICKLTAYMPISKDMLNIGPIWVDAYVRSTLTEALALALETGIVDGTGKDMPIGMDRSVADNVTVTGGVYPKKEATAITAFDPISYGNILDKISKTPTGKRRPVPGVILVVNPSDYFTKVFPATTLRTTNGTYATNVFPFPTTVIQSPAVPEGQAIMGLASKYFMGIGGGTAGGKIEYSDEFQFLDDNRVYVVRMYGNGRALDDNAFQLLDISGVVPADFEVQVTNVVKTKEQA